MGIQRLSDDTDGGNPRLLDRIHHGRKRTEGDIFVGAEKYRLVLRVAYFLPQLGANLVNVDGIVAQKHPLLLVDADHQALLSDFLHRARLGNRNLDSRLENGCGHHEDDEQHEYNVHQRSYVDVGKRDLCAAVGSGERHYRRASSGMRGAAGWRSTAFAISSEKSSQRA